MARVQSEYEVESLFIERLVNLGYKFLPMINYDDIVSNFRVQLCKVNEAKLVAAKDEAVFSDTEFHRVMLRLDI